MKTIEIKAKTVDEAVEQGLKELKSTRENTEIEVLNRGGMFTSAQVKLTVKDTPQTKATDFVNNVLSLMGFSATASYADTKDGIEIRISGGDAVNAIGYRGETLDALQYLALIVANKGEEGFFRISVNTENYREKRAATLGDLAEKLACKAERLNKKIQLEPMNPFERRAIHTALQNSEIATSESEGEEPNRYVVITPKNFVPSGRGNDTIRSGPREEKGGDRGRRAPRGEFRSDGQRDGQKDGQRGNYNRDRGGYNRDGYNRDRGERPERPERKYPSAAETAYTPSEETAPREAGDFKKKGMPRTRSFGPRKKGF